MAKRVRPNAEDLQAQLSVFAEDELGKMLQSVNAEQSPSNEEMLSQPGLPVLHTDATVSSLAGYRPPPAEVQLNAYLASALTGLNDEQMALVERVSSQVERVCNELNIALYQPAKVTHPVEHADVPDVTVYDTDRDRVVNSDLVIHLMHFPSTGAGEELDIAYNAMVPILLIHKGDTRLSRMVTGIPGLILRVEYADDDDLRRDLKAKLVEIRPQLLQRKLAFSDYSINIVGDRIRKLRQQQGLTREDLAEASKGRFSLSVDMLRLLEESDDRKSNPSLLQLRELATLLKVSVSELVEPNFDALLFAQIGNWVLGGPAAARFGQLSSKDTNKLVRRVLLRLVDQLEEDE